MKDVREILKNNLISHTKAKGISQKELSSLLGVSQSAVSHWFKGDNSPNIEIVSQIASLLSIPIATLLSGTDELEKQSSLSPSEMEHIKKYRTLDGYGKKMVDIVLDLEIQRQADSKAALRASEDELSANVIELPLFDQPASAGYGNWLDETDSDLIPVPDTPTTRRADFCIRVSGDSMEPKYSDGDLVFVRKQSDVNVGEFGIWVIDGSAYIKQRAADSLHSLNPDYEDVEHGEDVFCVGKVIGKM